MFNKPSEIEYVNKKDNDRGLEKISMIIADLHTQKIDFVNFVEEFEKICFNDISSINLNYFSDGFDKMTVINFMKVCLKAFDGDDMAIQRLYCDLDLKGVL